MVSPSNTLTMTLTRAQSQPVDLEPCTLPIMLLTPKLHYRKIKLTINGPSIWSTLSSESAFSSGCWHTLCLFLLRKCISLCSSHTEYVLVAKLKIRSEGIPLIEIRLERFWLILSSSWCRRVSSFLTRSCFILYCPQFWQANGCTEMSWCCLSRWFWSSSITSTRSLIIFCFISRSLRNSSVFRSCCHFCLRALPSIHCV